MRTILALLVLCLAGCGENPPALRDNIDTMVLALHAPSNTSRVSLQVEGATFNRGDRVQLTAGEVYITSHYSKPGVFFLVLPGRRPISLTERGCAMVSGPDTVCIAQTQEEWARIYQEIQEYIARQVR